jgi:hypothetical protein
MQLADAGCVRADASCSCGRWTASAQMHCVRADVGCVRANASVLPPGNFITDAIVRPSHG